MNAIAPLTPAGLAETLVARHFRTHGADLVVGDHSVAALAAQFGTPLYIYDAEAMRANFRTLAAAVSGFADIHYSVKANPDPAVIALFLAEGAGVEIASLGEYRRAIAAGARPEQILFAGPGKRRAELEAVVDGGIGEIHVETLEEIDRLEAIGAARDRRIDIAIRINPVASAQGGAMRMGGKPTAFGFDEEDVVAILAYIAARPHLRLTGLHVFAGTQILDAEVLLTQWAHGLDLAVRVAAIAGHPLRTIDLGGGLGIPYFEGDATLDLARVADGIPALLARKSASAGIADARVVIEPGRYLAGPGGLYVAEVNAVKVSRGSTFVITDGGMHHHLAASGNLGQVVKRDYPLVTPARMAEAPAAQPVSVVGPLCTPLDTLARKAVLPQLRSGDLVAILQSGAYGLTASPNGFLSHDPPAEVLVDGADVRPLGQ